MSSEVAIRAHGLGKVYRLYNRPQDRLKELVFRRRGLGHDFWALRDLDMEVRRGETIGIIGRNGSGKSTLLQIVCGTVQPSTGELEVRGRVAALLELGAGFNPEFTGRENVHLSATVLGLSEADIADRFPAIEAFAEIGDFIDQPVRQYSSGMYARLAFAVCAHVDADILVVDEILAVGDTGFQLRCMRFLNAFRARGTLLFVSHDEGSVMSLCDRAIWLNKGVAQASGPSREVCAAYRAFLSRGMESGSAFRTGGVLDQAIPSADAPDAGAPLKAFDFDLDSAWARSGEPTIERALLRHPNGQAADIVDGGGEVSLRIELRAARDLDEPIVGFVVRNRLGQVIFRDNTAATTNRAPRRIGRGESFAAIFRFRMPHLPTGDYAIEPALFERSGAEPVDRLLDALFVHVDSNPFLGGLANVAMRHKRLVIGEGPSARVPVAMRAAATPLIDDQRWRHRNPMEIVPFNSAAPWYGHGGAKIVDAGFFRPDGTRLTRMQGGDEVELRIIAHAERAIERPIIGFMFRNALGQNIFGDNTAIGAPDENRPVAEGEALAALFHFQMPFLPVGTYWIVPSIVDGRQQGRLHLHWVEEATIVRVAESPVDRCVVGVPMIDINLDLELIDADGPSG
jgi:lipopolysaccharide transport system ATP-binding protein